jgi:hypothetical protein
VAIHDVATLALHEQEWTFSGGWTRFQAQKPQVTVKVAVFHLPIRRSRFISAGLGLVFKDRRYWRSLQGSETLWSILRRLDDGCGVTGETEKAENTAIKVKFVAE